MYHSKLRIYTILFYACNFGGETPVNDCGALVSASLSDHRCFSHLIDIRDSVIEALEAYLYLRAIEPTAAFGRVKNVEPESEVSRIL